MAGFEELSQGRAHFNPNDLPRVHPERGLRTQIGGLIQLNS
jgi:hypothetical protein